MEIVFISFALGIPLLLNILATKAIIRCEGSERQQKIAQLLFVWLIPLVGAVIALAVHRPVEPPSRKYREQPDPGDDFVSAGRGEKGLSKALGDD